MKRRIRQNNLVTIPKAFLEILKLQEGDRIDVRLNGKRIEIVPLHQPASESSGNTQTPTEAFAHDQ